MTLILVKIDNYAIGRTSINFEFYKNTSFGNITRKSFTKLLTMCMYLFVCFYFCISNFAPNDFIIFKNEGEEVKTVSKFFIFVFAPVNIAKTKVDIAI